VRLWLLTALAAAALAAAGTAAADRPVAAPTLASLGAFRSVGQAHRFSSVANPSRCGGRGSYGWPLRPFGSPHPVRGNFGDPRTVYETLAGSVSFHNGIDISAADGTPVYPVVSGVAWVMGPHEIVVRTDDLRSFQYWHIDPAVVNAQHVHAGRTILGRVHRGAGHVHLSEIDDGVVVNPLAPGHLVPYSDRRPPTVHGIAFRDPDGRPLAPNDLGGPLTVVAWADDAQSRSVPGPWHGLPVAPAAVLLFVDRTLRAVTDFRRTIPDQDRFWSVYASGTYQNAPAVGRHLYTGRRGRYLFRFDLPALRPGPHDLEILAEDVCGNRGALAERVRAPGVVPEPAIAARATGIPARRREPARARPERWPLTRTAYTVVLASIPDAAGRPSAAAAIRRAAAGGLPRVGQLRSSSFGGLAPGFRVVFSGAYRSAREAAEAAFRASSLYPGAYPRLVVARVQPQRTAKRPPPSQVLVLASLPAAEGRAAAQREVVRAREAGLTGVRLLRSDRVGGLRRGYWIVVSAPGPIPPIYPDAYLRRLGDRRRGATALRRSGAPPRAS
jgi:hypothetical protein